MLASLLRFVRKPFEYVGLLEELEPEMTEYEAELVRKYHDFFKEEPAVYKERQGYVTQISNNAIELDHAWIYNLRTEEHFTVGEYVSYKLYKTEFSDEVRDVVRVADRGELETKTVSRAQIVNVDGSQYQTHAGIIFYLDKVQCHPGYRPMLLDFVNLECSYPKEDADSEEFDPEPGLVLVKRVSPCEDRLVFGKITSWDPSSFTGVVNDRVVFHQDVCIELTPALGVSVACDCVTGEYAGGYTSRAYKMTKNNQQLLNKGHFFVVERVPMFEVVLGETKTVDLCITNQSSDRVCIVNTVEFKSRNQTIELNHGLKLPYHILPGIRASWPVEVRGDRLGRHELKLLWYIGEKKSPIMSTILYRTVSQFKVGSEVNPMQRRRAPVVIPGQRSILNPVYRKVPMKEYPVSERLREICFENRGSDGLEMLIALNMEMPCLTECLSPQNYGEIMHTLLFLEEIADEEVYERLATRGALFRTRDFVTFRFPAESEYRKIVCGDKVRASKPWEDVKYDSLVWVISSTQLSLKFSDAFEMPSAAQFDLEFLMNRRPYQRRHQAVDLVLQNLGADWLFPNELNSDNTGPETEINMDDIAWLNPDLNVEQKTAVKNILTKKNLPYPYIIYGPPGTGKTVTIVESILQIISRQANCRILVTAPTNSAVDTLGTRLLEYSVFDKAEMVRLSSYNSYRSGRIAAQLMDISLVPNFGDPAHDTPISTDLRKAPVLYLENIGKFKVVIGTLATISLLNSAGIPKGHFTHIIIDEAGQCHEPDTLQPIALVQPNETQLVLAGDPQQLGPSITSRVAKQYSFDISFLDRLTKTYLYRKKADDFTDTHGYNPMLITKLVLNYRSLPKIVDLVGSVFYGGDLRPTISETDSREASILRSITIHREKLKDGMASLIFINVNTPEEQVEGNMSWMNQGEVGQVFLVLTLLYQAKVSPDDIGVITPYSLQKKKIYEFLDTLGAHSPKVASVEEFQGQERDVVILSLVRNNLGISNRVSDFITDPHRVNVALSRARVLNIIIGNRNTLLLNPLWGQIITKCRQINFESFPDPD